MVNQQPGRLQRLGEPRKTIVHVEKIERVKGRAMTDETTQALLPVTQGGPRITVKASCFDCPFVVSESYHVQSDSGSNVYCAHPSFEKRRRVGDTVWDTPDFCPVADIPAIRARVLSHSLPGDTRLAHSLPSQADTGISEPTKRMEQTLGAKFQPAILTAPPTSDAGEVSYGERLEYEARILAAEMVAVRLKRLVPQPSEPGIYVGDNFYPVGGTEASHEWDGERWNWLPNLEISDPGFVSPPTSGEEIRLREALLPLRDILGLSAEPGNNRVLCLHFNREVSGADREAVLAAVNLAPRAALTKGADFQRKADSG